MEHRTSEVIEILGFKVMETAHLRNGRTIKYHYNIRNKEGEVVSRNYESFEEPVELLRNLARYLDKTTNRE